MFQWFAIRQHILYSDINLTGTANISLARLDGITKIIIMLILLTDTDTNKVKLFQTKL